MVSRRPSFKIYAKDDRWLWLLLMKTWPNGFANSPGGNTYWLAMSRIQDVLALEVQTPAWVPGKGHEIDPSLLPNVKGHASGIAAMDF